MLNLLLSTLAMMGLTFLIGFFVAAVIKIIAGAADYFDFYHTHHKELLRLRHLRRLHQKMGKLIRQTSEEEIGYDDGREDFSRGINRDYPAPQGYYHDISPGVSEASLSDYYYPEDTRILYLKKQEEILCRDAKLSRESDVNKK